MLNRVTVLLFVAHAAGLIIGSFGATSNGLLASEHEPEETARLFAQLVSKNMEPELKEHDTNSLRQLGPTKVPLFPTTFDWENQKVVRRSVLRLGKAESDEDWDELLKHLKDDRYCITVYPDYFNNPINYSIGKICSELARHRLSDPFLKDRGFDRRDRLVMIDYKSDDMVDLRKWREARRDKKLYQLQLEVGERILDAIKDVKYVTEEWKEKSSNKLKMQLETLARNKTPFETAFGNDSFPTYSAKQAEKIRTLLK